VRAIQRSKLEVAKIIEDFLEGTGGKYDWDDFCSFPIADSYLDAIRVQCSDLQRTHPADQKGHYCNKVGLDLMRGLVAELRKINGPNPA